MWLKYVMGDPRPEFRERFEQVAFGRGATIEITRAIAWPRGPDSYYVGLIFRFLTAAFLENGLAGRMRRFRFEQISVLRSCPVDPAVNHTENDENPLWTNYVYPAFERHFLEGRDRRLKRYDNVRFERYGQDPETQYTWRLLHTQLMEDIVNFQINIVRVCYHRRIMGESRADLLVVHVPHLSIHWRDWVPPWDDEVPEE